MASYNIGELLLELGVQGEAELSRTLANATSKITEADRAGQSFYRHNRQGYTELKQLATTGAAAVGKLKSAFDAGELSATEYAQALDLINNVNAVASVGGTRLASSIRDVSSEMAAAINASRNLNASLQKNVQGARAAEGAYDDVGDRLEDLEADYREAAAAANDFYAAQAKAASAPTPKATSGGGGRRGGGGGGGGDGGSPGDDKEFVRLSNELRILEGNLRSGRATIEQITPAVTRLKEQILDNADAVAENRKEYAGWMQLAGRAGNLEIKPGVDFDRAKWQADITSVDSSFKVLNAEIERSGRLTELTQAKMAELSAVAKNLADEMEPGAEQGKMMAISGRAAKIAHSPVVDISNESLEKLQKYEQRLLIIDNLHRAGVTNTRTFRRELDELKDEAVRAAEGMDKLSDEYTEYISVAGRAGAITQRLDTASLRESYFSKQFILGNALSNMYGELGIRAFDLAANTIRSFDDMAVAWERANDQTGELITTSAQMGASFSEVSQHVEAVSEKYFTLASDAEGAAAALLESGMSVEQVRDLLDAVGASALQNGQSVREAFAAIASSGGDIEGALTSATGSTEAYDRALLSAASGQRDMVGSLTATERQAALVAAVMDGAGDALDGYKTRTDGIVGAQLAQSEAVQKFRREMGEELAPTVLKTTQAMTNFVVVMTGAIGPVVNAAEAVGMLAGKFSASETMLLGMVVLGPRFIGWLKGTTLATAGLSAALRGVVGILGGWPMIIAVAGVAAFSFFNGMESRAEKAEKAIKGLSDESGAMGVGLEQLKSATDKDGLLGAVDALAASMDGDAATAFTDFATNAVETADTTVGAIDKIYAYLAQQRKVAVQDALDTINMAIGPDEETRVAATTEFNTNGDGAKLEGLRAKAAELEVQIAAVQDASERGVLDVTDAIFQLDNLDLKLASIHSQIANIEGQGVSRGVLSPEEQARNVQLLKERARYEKELALIESNPRQAVDAAYGITPPAPSGTGGGGGGGGDGDGLQEYRNNVEVARAELGLLRQQHEQLGTDASYANLSQGMQGLIADLSLLTGEMKAINQLGDLSAANQVNMLTLLGEEAALRAELANSVNVERERKAALWVGGLEQKVGRGDLEAEDAMKRLTDAQAKLKAEMDAMPELALMSPEQLAQFEMFGRLLEMVEGGMATFQAALDEDADAARFETAMRSAREFQKVSQEIPEAVMAALSESGTNMDPFESYNEGIRAGIENAAELLGVQMDLEESIIRAAREQRNAGEPVTPVVNRRDALQSAADAAGQIDSAEAQALAVAYQAQADALSVVILRSQGLADIRTKVAEQSAFVADAFDAADRAAQESADAGGSGLAQQAARVESLRGSLDSAVDSWGKTSTAARQLTRELAPLSEALKKNEAFWESQGENNADAVLAQLASQQYETFAEAVEALGLATDDTTPLMEALKAAFNMDETQPQIDRLKELAEAYETVRYAFSQGVEAPQWAVDKLAEGGAPVSSADGTSVNTAALREANLLIEDYNAGRAAGPSLVSDLRQAESQLLAEYHKINGATAEGKRRMDMYQKKIEEVQALLGKETKLDFLTGANQQGLVNDKDFSAFATKQIEVHKKKQAELFKDAKDGNLESMEAWNGHQAAINLYTSAIEEAATPTAALSQGFANLSASLSAAGMNEAAAGADILAGTFAGLDTILKGGSVEDGIRAIGEAFQQSADVGVAALGKMISGVTDLAVGIASGDPGAIVGGVLGLLSGLIDIFTMGAKELAEAEEEVRNYNKGFSIVNAEGVMTARAPTHEEKAEEYQSGRAQAAADGIIWPWEDYGAWQAAIMPIKIDDASLKASFESAESGLSSAISGALKNFMQTGSLGDFKAAFKEAVFDGLVEGFIASEAFKTSLGDPLNNFYTVSADPNATQAEVDAVWYAVEQGYAQAEQQMISFAERWAGTFGAEMLTADLKGMFAGAAQAGLDARLNMNVGIGDTTGVEAFKEAFTLSLKDMVKQRLIEAFLESAAMKPLFDELGAYLGKAMKDGVIDAGESAMIDSLTQGIADATVPLYDALEKIDGPRRIELLVEQGSLSDLWKELDRLNDPKLNDGKKAQLKEEIRINNTIKDRVKLTMDELRLALHADLLVQDEGGGDDVFAYAGGTLEACEGEDSGAGGVEPVTGLVTLNCGV